MALRDQPYLPLYIQDFLTDEKLMECSASATGVYIRLMCVMHKSEIYGSILLKQKFKQTDKQDKNFALQLAKYFPYDFASIHSALIELIDEQVLIIDGDLLIQKRMVKDAQISEKRAKSGQKGGNETQKKSKKPSDFAKANNEAKLQANSEYENEYVIEINTEKEKKIKEATLKILTDFKFTELNHQNKLRQISDFIRLLISNNRFEYFQNQYPAYWKYKELSGDKYQSIDTFLADGWDKEVWSEKLKELNNGKSRQQKPDISKLTNLTDQILANAGINLSGTNS